MDFIPLLFICGSYNRTKPLSDARFCPNCGLQNGAVLYESYNRCHFCFVPLFKTGAKSR
jgi:hypothetical protein